MSRRASLARPLPLVRPGDVEIHPSHGRLATTDVARDGGEMIRHHSRRSAQARSWTPKAACAAAAACAALALTPDAARAQCGAAPELPTFGELGLLGFRFDLAEQVGLNAHHVVGKTATWSNLQPDGVNFNASKLLELDREIKQAMSNGMKAVTLRVRPGGGGLEPFAGSSSSWPVDLTTYSSKDGEWLGPRNGAALESQTSFPPKILTRDEAGHTSPWYEFVRALAIRYNGCTPDPDPDFLGSKLPRVDFWSTIHESDSKGFWYGTSKDMFGGVGGDSAVGLQPSFYRAVKAGNPAAVVTSGGPSSQTLGYYMTFAKAQQAGNKYTIAVRNWGKSFFHTSIALQAVFNTYPNDDAGLYNHYATDLNELRSRNMVDAMFTETADDYYDVVAAHFYDNPLMEEELLAFLETRERVAKPLWLSEVGFVNQSSTFTTADQARWLIQKMVIAVANGVQHTTYSPIMSSPTAPTFAPLFDGLPGNPGWRPAAYAAQLVDNAIDEASGYTFVRKRSVNGVTFYEFAHDDGVHHQAFGWHPSASASVDLRGTFAIPAGTPIDIQDYQGQALWSASTDSTYDVGMSPVLIQWSGSAGPGCGRVADTAQPWGAVLGTVVLALPILLRAVRNVRRPAVARVPVR